MGYEEINFEELQKTRPALAAKYNLMWIAETNLRDADRPATDYMIRHHPHMLDTMLPSMVYLRMANVIAHGKAELTPEEMLEEYKETLGKTIMIGINGEGEEHLKSFIRSAQQAATAAVAGMLGHSRQKEGWAASL